MITRDELQAVVARTREIWNAGTRGTTRLGTINTVAKEFGCPKELVEMVLRSATGQKSYALFN